MKLPGNDIQSIVNFNADLATVLELATMHIEHLAQNGGTNFDDMKLFYRTHHNIEKYSRNLDTIIPELLAEQEISRAMTQEAEKNAQEGILPFTPQEQEEIDKALDSLNGMTEKLKDVLQEDLEEHAEDYQSPRLTIAEGAAISFRVIATGGAVGITAQFEMDTIDEDSESA